MYLLGFDIGSSSVKCSLVDAQSGACLGTAFAPKSEAPIKAINPGWAEQNPEDWWSYLKAATADVLSQSKINVKDIAAIGISYQMHGLVCVDKLLDVEEEEMKKACDKNDSTVCFVQGDRLVIDLGSERLVSSFHYLPDQGAPGKGLIASYEIAVGSSLAKIDKVVKQDEFSNIRNNPILQRKLPETLGDRHTSVRAGSR